MVDQKFFKNSGKLTCEEICNLANADCQSDVCDTVFTDVAPLSKATPSDISFLDNVKYKQDLIDTKAGACFVKEEFIDLVPKTTIALVSQSPYRSYALTARAFYPEPSFDRKVEKLYIQRPEKIEIDDELKRLSLEFYKESNIALKKFCPSDLRKHRYF